MLDEGLIVERGTRAVGDLPMLLRGVRAELDLSVLLRKRAAVIATALRSRPVEEKAAICASVVEHVWPLVAEGTVRPIVHRTLPLDEVAQAHALMESGEHTGKIVLTCAP